MFKFSSVLFALVATSQAIPNKIVCYFGNWAVYRPGDGQFDVDNIDPFLCTHLIYAFIGLNVDFSVNMLDYHNSIDNGAIDRFNALRNQNPNLKTMISMGGWNEGSERFSDMALTSASRTIFINNVVNFMETFGFDGFDLNWEYPAQRGGRPEDKDNFVQLLSELREVFDQRGWILSAAVAAFSYSVDISYDVPGVNRYLDFINVMTYDLHGYWDGRTGQNAPLFPSSLVWNSGLNVDDCISGWMARGASPDKLVLGVAAYGRTFTLQNSLNNHLGAATIGGGQPGPYTRTSGMLGYNEICLTVQSGWNVVWDEEQKVPFAYSENQWMGFDNARSIGLKVEYALSMGLGGIMVWSVETDDFRGLCGISNPLLNQIRATLNYNQLI